MADENNAKFGPGGLTYSLLCEQPYEDKEKREFGTEAKKLVNSIGPKLEYNFTYDPVFPKTNSFICAISHSTENGSTYGFDTIYLVWKRGGKLEFNEFRTSEPVT